MRGVKIALGFILWNVRDSEMRRRFYASNNKLIRKAAC